MTDRFSDTDSNLLRTSVVMLVLISAGGVYLIQRNVSVLPFGYYASLSYGGCLLGIFLQGVFQYNKESPWRGRTRKTVRFLVFAALIVSLVGGAMTAAVVFLSTGYTPAPESAKTARSWRSPLVVRIAQTFRTSGETGRLPFLRLATLWSVAIAALGWVVAFQVGAKSSVAGFLYGMVAGHAIFIACALWRRSPFEKKLVPFTVLEAGIFAGSLFAFWHFGGGWMAVQGGLGMTFFASALYGLAGKS